MKRSVRVYVPDADAAVAAAVAHGAQVITEVTDSAWGDRGGRVRDPLGNIWWVMSRVEDVTPDLAWERMAEPKHAESMRMAQETLDAALSGRKSGRASAPQRPSH
ncbi:VOC family protein [Streptomyces sp. NPDC056508]|uniref:VOC family protein n=1 Tax=Streptomyces sp. NPDC056508 TaxID=3345845 RepID=UPI003693B734